MSEHLLIYSNTKKIPLSIIRPAFISAAHEDPAPGWTDGDGTVMGVSLMVGLGLLKNLHGSDTYLADIIPVDFVAR
jgi:hypothetical protein